MVGNTFLLDLNLHIDYSIFMKALILEDDEHLAETLVIYLQCLSVISCYADSVDRYISILTTFRPEIVFIDLLIDGSIATSIIDTTKIFNPKIKVVVFTALNEAESLLQYSKYDYLLHKPFNLVDLDNIILKHSIDNTN